ncbi:hypothetical protein DMA11_24195 [Marinilabiliaceae bacterium JC017]|nr:hypothetical protein DMA11_24195 [Marinilabiliaceae bacterium JC017]
MQATTVLNEIITTNPTPQITMQTIPGADHNMLVGTNGCGKEQLKNYNGITDIKTTDTFYFFMMNWLKNFKP